MDTGAISLHNHKPILVNNRNRGREATQLHRDTENQKHILKKVIEITAHNKGHIVFVVSTLVATPQRKQVFF